MLRLIVLIGLLLLAPFELALGENASIVSISTPRGVHQAFILIKPDHPQASVILFSGGDGVLRLNRMPQLKVGPNDFVAGNFLVRSRQNFAAHDLMVAVVDAPSDHLKGMSPYFRISKDHATDIGAVAEYLKREADVPVWLVGTSAGSWSAALGAISAGRDDIATSAIGGLVLTSTVTRIPQDSVFGKAFPTFAGDYPDGVMSTALPEVRVPTLIMSHRDDGCVYTPAVDAPALGKRLSQASKVEIAVITGGDPPQSDPCEAYAAHGYLGVEAQAVDTIARFIKTRGAHEP